MEIMDLSTWKVLAVDDEPDSLEVLIEALGMHDATVHSTGNGQEALALLQTLHPTLVVTDLSMPGMDGYQLLYRIRHTEDLKATPVIALTAHAMSGDKERILEAGFNGYISKPLRIATLVPTILEYLPLLKPEPAQPDAAPVQALKPEPAQPDTAPTEIPKPEPAQLDAVPTEAPTLEPAQPNAAPAQALKPEPAQPDTAPAEIPKPEPAQLDAVPTETPALEPTQPDAGPAQALKPEPAQPDALPVQLLKPDPADAVSK
jgi:CheY-like chemotaxis protein